MIIIFHKTVIVIDTQFQVVICNIRQTNSCLYSLFYVVHSEYEKEGKFVMLQEVDESSEIRGHVTMLNTLKHYQVSAWEQKML